MTWKIIRTYIIISLSIFFHQSHAAEPYFNYIADYYLHEHHQARNPHQVIRYSDGERGLHLQSLLTPARVKAALTEYFASKKRGENIPDLPRLLQPLAGRYEEAFKKDRANYEDEYLDSLDATAEILLIAAEMVNIGSTSFQTHRSSGKGTEQEKALMDSMEPLLKMSREFTAMANKAVALEIRKKVNQGKFTKNGAKRALEIAARISP